MNRQTQKKFNAGIPVRGSFATGCKILIICHILFYILLACNDPAASRLAGFPLHLPAKV
jgi:hypothetical protein